MARDRARGGQGVLSGHACRGDRPCDVGLRQRSHRRLVRRRPVRRRPVDRRNQRAPAGRSTATPEVHDLRGHGCDCGHVLSVRAGQRALLQRVRRVPHVSALRARRRCAHAALVGRGPGVDADAARARRSAARVSRAGGRHDPVDADRSRIALASASRRAGRSDRVGVRWSALVRAGLDHAPRSSGGGQRRVGVRCLMVGGGRG